MEKIYNEIPGEGEVQTGNPIHVNEKGEEVKETAIEKIEDKEEVEQKEAHPDTE